MAGSNSGNHLIAAWLDEARGLSDSSEPVERATDIRRNDRRAKVNLFIAFHEMLIANKAMQIFDRVWSPECLDFIYSRPQITFSFNHLIQSPSYSGTFPIYILPAALTRMHYLAFADTI